MQSNAITKRAAPTGAWKPGQSGNPAGRPRTGLALAEMIRQHVPPEDIIAVAVDIARNAPDDSHRLAAVKFLAEYGYVKAPVVIDVPDAKPRDLVDWSKVSASALADIVGALRDPDSAG